MCLSSRTLALKEGLELRIEQMRHFVELYETDLVVYANNTRATYKTTKDNALKELPSEMVSALRILIEHRNFAGIPIDNEYIFASGENYLKGWEITMRLIILLFIDLTSASIHDMTCLSFIGLPIIWPTQRISTLNGTAKKRVQ